uniref:Bm4918 n=2 Tax=Brugia malayi TaxID=6279 RepID=A0A1I9GD20_BRUMA|nr:Bm4918 [Brugia malayi]
MSLTPLYQSFPVFFFIMNEESVWAAGTLHFGTTMFSGNSNYNSVLKVLNSIRMKRVYRDVGVLSTPFVNAFVTGIIGTESMTYRPYPSDGGCKWFGTAPFCSGHCQAEYDYIRNSNGRCSNWWFAGVCKPDPSFGEPCSTILGGNFKKHFCCKSDPSECTWSGRWMSAFSAHNIYCRCDNHGHCGHLECSVNHFNYHAQNSTEISGDRCDQISLFGFEGKATCGYIAWFDNSETLVDNWYKSK